MRIRPGVWIDFPRLPVGVKLHQAHRQTERVGVVLLIVGSPRSSRDPPPRAERQSLFEARADVAERRDGRSFAERGRRWRRLSPRLCRTAASSDVGQMPLRSVCRRPSAARGRQIRLAVGRLGGPGGHVMWPLGRQAWCDNGEGYKNTRSPDQRFHAASQCQSFSAKDRSRNLTVPAWAPGNRGC